MTELLAGRERRYFGYTRDIAHKIDTPESAKSFRSIISPIARTAKRKYNPNKSFKPDPIGHTRFADKIVQQSVKTQIPGLLPALKNSPQFDEFEDNPIYLRSPDFEKQFGRSLYHLWLKQNDRSEMCQQFHRHLRAKEKGRFMAGKRQWLKKGTAGMDAEAIAASQQEFVESIAQDSKISRARTKRGSDVPTHIQRMNRKFQMSFWDPTYNKNLQDPFRRGKNRTPALDSMCHEYFGHAPEHGLLTCLEEYKRRYEQNLDLNGDNIDLNEGKDRVRRISLFGTLEEEMKRRGYKHIKQLSDYDRESQALWDKQSKLIISSIEYINKIKQGRRFPTPPRELQRTSKRKGGDRMSGNSSKSELHNNASQHRQDRQSNPSPNARKSQRQNRKSSPSPNPNARKSDRKSERKSHHSHHHHHHHHHQPQVDDYNSEDFYMEMYLHFLNPDEDVSVKAPPRNVTDMKELRRKMNLDEDHEKERKLVELLNADSVEALHIHGVTRRTIEHHTHHDLNAMELEHEKEILEHHMQRLNNPHLTHLLTRMVSQISLTNSTLTMTSSSSAKTDEQQDDHTTTMAPPTTIKTDKDDDLDQLGDIPEHELRLIMSEIADSKGSGSTDNLSSGSSIEDEEEEGEGEVEATDEIKLFQKVRRKKDSLVELMDLTEEFRERVCKGAEGVPQGKMNPFAEAVCVLYADKPGAKKKKKTMYAPDTSRKTLF